MTKIPQTVKAAHLIDVTSSDALALANTARPARDIPGRSNSGPHHHDSDFMPGVPHLSPRNAPIPNRQPNTLRSMTRSGTVTPDANPAYTDIETGLGLHSPSKDGGSAPSREVSFARKLQATLSTGLGVGVPLAAANVGTERIAGALLDMAHSRHLPPTSLRASFAAGSLGIAADIVVTGMVTAAGHVYLDKKFYHDQNKTADEMIAAKKANSVILSYLGGRRDFTRNQSCRNCDDRDRYHRRHCQNRFDHPSHWRRDSSSSHLRRCRGCARLSS